MKIPSTIVISDDEVADMFQAKTHINLWDAGEFRCPEGSVNVQYCESTYYKEQNYIQHITHPEDNFDKWDDKLETSYFQTEEEALNDLNKLTNKDTITYDHCLSFLVTYGYIPKVDLYIITNTALCH